MKEWNVSNSRCMEVHRIFGLLRFCSYGVTSIDEQYIGPKIWDRPKIQDLTIYENRPCAQQTRWWDSPCRPLCKSSCLPAPGKSSHLPCLMRCQICTGNRNETTKWTTKWNHKVKWQSETINAYCSKEIITSSSSEEMSNIIDIVPQTRFAIHRMGQEICCHLQTSEKKHKNVVATKLPLALTNVSEQAHGICASVQNGFVGSKLKQYRSQRLNKNKPKLKRTPIQN